jgi:orotate phosphoribosyltransferase
MPSLLDLVPARRGHFKLESGHHGSLWLDLEPLFVLPNVLAPLVIELAEKVGPHTIQAVCGPLLGGAFLAQNLAALLDVEFYYTERFVPPEAEGLFKVQYRLPPSLQKAIAGKRVAIVDDAISAGSSVRATLAELNTHGAQTIVIGSLLTLGTVGLDYFAAQGVPVETTLKLPFTVWTPETCPMCAAGEPLDTL